MPEHLTKKFKKGYESYLRISKDMRQGVVTFDYEKCKGCGLCVSACVAAVLEMTEDKPRMNTVLPACIACGDCCALCPENAIQVTRYQQFNRRYHYLDRGEPEWPRAF